MRDTGWLTVLIPTIGEATDERAADFTKHKESHMARPMTDLTKNILAILEKNPDITYNEGVDQGLIDPAVIEVGRFNVTKSNLKKKAQEAASPSTPKVKAKKIAVPKVKAVAAPKRAVRTAKMIAVRTAKMIAVPNVNDITAAMKAVADAGGIAKAQALIARANALQAALSTVTTTQATLAKIA